jgi:hypothetical protein
MTTFEFIIQLAQTMNGNFAWAVTFIAIAIAAIAINLGWRRAIMRKDAQDFEIKKLTSGTQIALRANEAGRNARSDGSY